MATIDVLDSTMHYGESRAAPLVFGPAGHQAPEDRPKEIAAAITDWADRHGLGL
ncbi:hypothetical protein ACFVZW_15360 [Streptomyces sp. NPDC059567]|uniref:hypothetical protein n=1 Tax=Streptomyces sp. NPDC059567 TaxID=3346867 RepID=UPI003681826E